MYLPKPVHYSQTSSNSALVTSTGEFFTRRLKSKRSCLTSARTRHPLSGSNYISEASLSWSRPAAPFGRPEAARSLKNVQAIAAGLNGYPAIKGPHQLLFRGETNISARARERVSAMKGIGFDRRRSRKQKLPSHREKLLLNLDGDATYSSTDESSRKEGLNQASGDGGGEAGRRAESFSAR